MKRFLLLSLSLFLCMSFANAQDKITDAEQQELLKSSPFNSLYPKSILKSSDTYFKSQMALYQQGAIDEKSAHLIALAASAASKCQYCVPYHQAELRRLGATEDEIKTAILLAGDVMRMSTLFYGNEYDLEAFKAMLRGE